MKERRGVVLGVILVVLVVVVGAALIGAPAEGTPLNPRSHEPDGTSALMALMDELGASVRLDADQVASEDDVALVLRDRLDRGQRSRLEAWVREGGVLVVVDPGSSLTPDEAPIPSGVGDPAESGAIGDLVVSVPPGECDIGPVDDPDINRIDVYGGPADYAVSGDAESCFGDGEAAYVVATSVGSGTVVAVGGSGIITNRSLGDGDNAPVIAAFLAPREGTRVAVFDPAAPAASGGDGEKSLPELISTPVWRGLAQLGLAFLVYVLWRSRRVGKPVVEPQPVKVAASELVSAVGGLLERSGSPQHAADVLRADLRRDVITRLGVPPDVPPATMGQILAERSSLDSARLQAALGPGPVETDQDLLLVAQLIDYVRKEVFDHVGS